MSNQDVNRILILGHSGFIGSRLEEYFKKHDSVEIMGKSFPEIDLTNFEHVRSLQSYFDKKTAIIMCSGLKRNFGDTLDTFDSNMAMVSNLCRGIEEKPVKRLIYLSSAAVYGEDVENQNLTELTPVHPTTYYGISKFASERLLWKSAEKIGMSLLILRPATIYGPNENINTYSPSGFARAMLCDEKITLWGDGKELREFIFIDDLVRIIHQLTSSSITGVLNVATGQSHTFEHILRLVSKYKALDVNSRERSKEKVDHIFNNALLRKALPGLEFTQLEDGIKFTLEREVQK